MIRAARWRALGVAAVAIIGMSVGVAPAFAAEPAAVGWWWAGRASAMIPVLLSPLPPVPEGGLYVAGDATGPTGISALRVELTPTASVDSLTLTIAETAGTPIVVACVAAEAWEPVENGVWDQRPDADCEVSIAGTVNTDETEVTFPLVQLPDPSGDLDLVLVPGVDPETEHPATFSVSFEPPGEDALAVTAPVGDDTHVNTGPDPSADAPVPSDPWNPPASPPPLTYASPSRAAPKLEAPAESEQAAPRPQPAALASSFPGTDGFAYPAVLGLPLALLAGGSYFAWALTRPVVIRSGPAFSKRASA